MPPAVRRRAAVQRVQCRPRVRSDDSVDGEVVGPLEGHDCVLRQLPENAVDRTCMESGRREPRLQIVDLFAARGGHVLAHIVGADRELAVTAVDQHRKLQHDIQILTDQYIKKIDEFLHQKEKEILQV